MPGLTPLPGVAAEAVVATRAEAAVAAAESTADSGDLRLRSATQDSRDISCLLQLPGLIICVASCRRRSA